MKYRMTVRVRELSDKTFSGAWNTPALNITCEESATIGGPRPNALILQAYGEDNVANAEQLRDYIGQDVDVLFYPSGNWCKRPDGTKYLRTSLRFVRVVAPAADAPVNNAAID